jgi:hypothetical protein
MKLLNYRSSETMCYNSNKIHRFIAKNKIENEIKKTVK